VFIGFLPSYRNSLQEYWNLRDLVVIHRPEDPMPQLAGMQPFKREAKPF
jgi:hypothetical protein